MKAWLIFAVTCLLPTLLEAAPLQQAQPWLGVAIDEQGTGGVLIKEVLEKTPAQAAGLQPGDLITAVDGSSVKSRDELIGILRSKGVGNSVSVQFQRKGQTQKQTLKLEALPDSVALIKKQWQEKPLPAMTLKRLADGKTVTRDSLLGKVTILEFWATWCPACRSAIPRLNQWSRQHKNINVIGITDENEEAVRQLVKQEKIEYTLAIDAQQKVQTDLRIGSIPSFLLIDAKGIVRDVSVGAGEYLEDILQKAERLAGGQ